MTMLGNQGCGPTTTFRPPITEPAPTGKPQIDTEATSQPGWSPLFTKLQGCEEKDVVFTVSPIDVEFITAVQPQGLLSTSHITPGDHVEFRYNPDGPARNLYAAADGYLKRVERQPSPVGYGVGADVKHYHLYFEYSCTLFGSYVHVTELAPELASADQQLQELDAGPQPKDTTSLWPNVPVQAGQLIGKTEYFGLFEMLTVDTNVTLPGLWDCARWPSTLLLSEA